MRASDPLYELGLRCGGHRREDDFWRQTLTALAAHVGVTAPVEVRLVCLDRRLQWSQADNLRHNAAVRSAVSDLTAPLHRLRAVVRRGRPLR